MNKIPRLLVVLTTVLTLTLSVIKPFAYAGMINIETALTTEKRSQILDRTHRVLLEDNVSKTLIDFGVDTNDVVQRIAGLTDDELVMLSGKIDQAPVGAGGLEVIGIVFIVLLILELVGVTDVFKKL